MRARRALVAPLLLAALASGVSVASPRLPDWAASLRATPTPADAGDADAFVLLDEERIAVPAKGRMEEAGRYAVRILKARGAERASMTLDYEQDAGRVTDLRAWLVHADGRIESWDLRDAADLSLSDYELYSSLRARKLDAPRAEPGATFVCEWREEEEQRVAEWAWTFASHVPVACSRFTLELPPGVTPAARLFHHAPFEPVRERNAWTWELRDLPATRLEPSPPAFRSFTPWLGVALNSPGIPGAGERVSFADWTAASRWYAGLVEPQAAVSDSLAAQATRLTAGLASPLDRARALGAYVQTLNYVAVEMDLARGGGWRPHPAADVLRLGYGDCKDKANLLRALLAAVGVQSWLVPAQLENPTAVEEAWPDLGQFDHCILAIQVPGAEGLPAAFRDPRLGTVLPFDPTDPLTAFGNLSAPLQGSLVMLAAGDRGGLVRLPVLAPAARRCARRVTCQLHADGALAAVVEERSVGAAARPARSLLRRQPGDFRRGVEAALAEALGRTEIERLDSHEDRAGDALTIELAFNASGAGRTLPGGLLALRPALFGAETGFEPQDSTRRTPLTIAGVSLAETVLVALPAGFTVDELPAEVREEGGIGSQRATWRVTPAGEVEFIRTLDVAPAVLPASRYEEARDFYGRVRGVERAVVVLKRAS